MPIFLIAIDFAAPGRLPSNVGAINVCQAFPGISVVQRIGGSTHSSEYIQANGVRLHCVTAGKGKLILFLHGFPEFWYAWKNQLAEFGRDHRVAALDMRGFNLSEKPAAVSDYRIETLITDVHVVAQQLSPDKPFVLAGHDWGGYVAWAFASAYREALEKLVIINAPHPTIFAGLLTSDPNQRKASEYMGMFRSAEAEQILSANEFEFLTKVMAFGKENGLPAEDKPEYIKAWSQPGAITGGLNYYRANNLASVRMLQLDSPEVVVNVPTLVIWGMNDPAMVPRNLEGLESYVRQLTVKRMPNASHWLVHTHSQEINRSLREFLA